MIKTAVRFQVIRTVSALAAGTRHARREDTTGRKRVRPGAQPGYALSWTAHNVPKCDQVAAFKAQKNATGARERKGAPIALAAMCIVSPGWIDEAGSRYAKDNPRNRLLVLEACRWAESWAGTGSVIAARLDLDEVGGGVVDLLIVPVRLQRSRGGAETLRISTNGALADLVMQTNAEPKSYAAAQTSWANWAKRKLDTRMERGVPREKTGAQHLKPEQYGRVMDDLKKLEADRVRIEAENLSLQQEAEKKAANYAKEMQAKTDAAMEQQLAPLRTLRGRWRTLFAQDEKAMLAVVEAAVAKAEQQQRADLNRIDAELRHSHDQRIKDVRTIKYLRESYAETKSQLDQANARLRDVTEDAVDISIDPRPA